MSFFCNGCHFLLLQWVSFFCTLVYSVNSYIIIVNILLSIINHESVNLLGFDPLLNIYIYASYFLQNLLISILINCETSSQCLKFKFVLAQSAKHDSKYTHFQPGAVLSSLFSLPLGIKFGRYSFILSFYPLK